MRIIYLFFMAIFLCSSLYASEIELRIGTMDLPPYGWEDSSFQKKGIIYELNEEIGKRSKLKYSNTILPFKRMLTLLKKGKIDLISSQAHKESLSSGEKLAVQFDINVIAGTRKKSNIKSFKDLRRKNFVFHRSASYKQLEGYPKTITRVNSYEQSIKVLKSNRLADAAVFSEPAYYYWMKELGYSKSDFGKVILIESGKRQWIIVRRGLSKKRKMHLKKIVEEIYGSDLYEKLLKKFGKN